MFWQRLQLHLETIQVYCFRLMSLERSTETVLKKCQFGSAILECFYIQEQNV